jgi:hypothetical protein
MPATETIAIEVEKQLPDDRRAIEVYAQGSRVIIEWLPFEVREKTAGQIRPQLCTGVRIIIQKITAIGVPGANIESMQHAVFSTGVENPVALAGFVVDRASADQHR